MRLVRDPKLFTGQNTNAVVRVDRCVQALQSLHWAYVAEDPFFMARMMSTEDNLNKVSGVTVQFALLFLSTSFGDKCQLILGTLELFFQ